MVAALVPINPGTACAGQTGLEPATCGFGDRCATNCATTLRGEKPLRPMRPTGFPEAQAIIVFSTPENQSTQQLRLRRTGPLRTPACLRKPTDSRQSHSGSGTPG